MKDSTSLLLLGGVHFFTASMLSGFTDIPLLQTIFPKNFTSVCKSWHLLGFNFKLYFWNLENTLVRLCMWLSKSVPRTITSSRYARHSFHDNPCSTNWITLLNVAGLLQSPNGSLVYWNRPYFVTNAVLCLSFSSSFT